MTNANPRLLVAIAAVMMVGQVSIASAAAVAFSDRLLITSPKGVEFDCSVGERVPEGLLTTASNCTRDARPVALLAPTDRPGDRKKNLDADILLFEDTALTKLSDHLKIRVIDLGANSNFLITFRSDGDPGRPITLNDLSDNVLRLFETGALQDVTRGAFPGYVANKEPFRVFVQSDAVPEPSSFVLLAAGLGGCAGLGWMRRRRS